MRYLRHVPRRFKTNFREGLSICYLFVLIFFANYGFYLFSSIIRSILVLMLVFGMMNLGTEAAPRKKAAAASA